MASAKAVAYVTQHPSRPPRFDPAGTAGGPVAARLGMPDAFYHPEGERGVARRRRAARAVATCARCPLIQACRTEALANREPYGTWGGLTEDDRVAIYAATPKPLQLPDWIERELMPA